MKTIKEWLNELPEPYRSEALANVDPTYIDYKEETGSLAEALFHAFSWDASAQGHDYWQILCTEAGVKGHVEAPVTHPQPFNLEAAKAGEPVEMEDGTPIHRFLCFDRAYPGYPIVATYFDKDGKEQTETFTRNGKYDIVGGCVFGKDLRMAAKKPKTVTRWMNVTKTGGNYTAAGNFYDNEEQARNAPASHGVIATVPVTFNV